MIIEVDFEDFLTDVVENILKEALLRTAQVDLTNESMLHAVLLDPEADRSELIFSIRPHVKFDQIVTENDVLLPMRDDLDEDLVFSKRRVHTPGFLTNILLHRVDQISTLMDNSGRKCFIEDSFDMPLISSEGSQPVLE